MHDSDANCLRFSKIKLNCLEVLWNTKGIENLFSKVAVTEERYQWL